MGSIALSLFLCAGLAIPALAGERQEERSTDLVRQAHELFEASTVKRIVTPAPGSRSVIVAVDGSTPLYLYLERGSIRGNAIDTFYEQYESGDLEAAYQTFLQHSVIVMRVSDYGWNGLGNPLVTESGSEIEDVYYKVSDGNYQRSDIDEEDIEQFNEMLKEVVIPALSGQG